MNDISTVGEYEDVLRFWFPEGCQQEIDATTHHGYWAWRMQGGADDEIVARYANLTVRGAEGALERWASDPKGRLALIIVLDQFSRSLFRGTARAFEQDRAALSLVKEGMSNGHYSALDMPWFKVVFGLPLGHCEGPDHLDRVDFLIKLREEIAAEAPAPLRPIYESLVTQARDVRKVIAAFGRHPHRNQVLGRRSTPEEEAYIAEGRFPHLKAFRS